MTMEQGRTVLVTGASRGAGRGIALALGRPDTTVYITGRTMEPGQADLPGTIGETAAAINAAGGHGIAVQCDHADDEQVLALFAQIEAEAGKLDVLVNNATAVPDGLTNRGPFWEKPLALSALLDVGLRSHYVAAFHAAPLLIKGSNALLVNTSSFGGRIYMHGPAYGGGKAAVDKMAHDMAIDFRPYDVAVISLWMGLLLTERTRRVFESDPELYADMEATAEHPEFSGRVIDALANDPERMQKSGKVWIGAELGALYGVLDVNGKTPPSHRPFFGPVTEFGDAVVQ